MAGKPGDGNWKSGAETSRRANSQSETDCVPAPTPLPTGWDAYVFDFAGPVSAATLRSIFLSDIYDGCIEFSNGYATAFYDGRANYFIPLGDGGQA
jgi:hypothetical protein